MSDSDIEDDILYDRGADFVHIFRRGSHLAEDIGGHLTCKEAEVIADLLLAFNAEPEDVHHFLVEHSCCDDEDDMHFDLRKTTENHN